MNTKNIIAAKHAADKLGELIRYAHTDAVNTGSMAQEALCFDLIGLAFDLENKVERALRCATETAHPFNGDENQ